MNNPTTRRHPRTLGEAFGGADYGCAIERPAPRPMEKVLDYALAIFIGLALAFGLFWGLSS
jgi:hypothetical protein